MKMKKIIAVSLTAALICSAFTACSSKKADETAATTTEVVTVADKDDEVKVEVDEEDDATIEVKDKDGNVLTIAPIYNTDGATVIAGYVESAKDKNGKALDQKSYPYIKGVVALNIDEENNFSLKYTKDNKIETIKAISDKNAYIIAIQDTLDIDKDKNVTEYFKVVTKLDSNKNLFIKLDKDDKGNPINVKVEEKKDANTGKTSVTVVDSTGKTITATVSTDAENLGDVVKKEKEEQKKKEEEKNKQEQDKNQGTDKTGNQGGNSNNGDNLGNSNNGGSNNDNNNNNNNDNNQDEKPEESAKEQIDIVLMDNGKVACDAENVTVDGNLATGGTEIIVNGAGEFSKYYVTSQTGTFLGKIEFRFSVDEDVEVKFYNVNISSGGKTAVKFTNVDSEVGKENDSEEVGVGGNTGTTAVTPAPKVEMSITGSNSFRASGSGTNGTIYSECKLAIKGHGRAEIDGGQSLSGICSTESVTIKNATLNIVSRAKQGISCDKKVTVEAGAIIDIESRGDGIHCNKFEFNGSETGVADSRIKIRSIDSVNCADGIDADEQIIINGGTLDVVALTRAKYALKCRKVIKGKPSGIFKINGGTVTASGNQNTILQSGSQKAVMIAAAPASNPSTFTVGNVSSENAQSFICSPVNVNSVTSSSAGEKNIEWNSNAGKVNF